MICALACTWRTVPQAAERKVQWDRSGDRKRHATGKDDEAPPPTAPEVLAARTPRGPLARGPAGAGVLVHRPGAGGRRPRLDRGRAQGLRGRHRREARDDREPQVPRAVPGRRLRLRVLRSLRVRQRPRPGRALLPRQGVLRGARARRAGGGAGQARQRHRRRGRRSSHAGANRPHRRAGKRTEARLGPRHRGDARPCP